MLISEIWENWNRLKYGVTNLEDVYSIDSGSDKQKMKFRL